MKKAMLTAGLAMAALNAVAGAADPYPVSVWTRVLFGVDGKPVEYAIVDEDKYPPKFAENVKVRVARATIQPPIVDGKPVTLKSGVEMLFTVTPTPEGGGTVRVDGLSMGPMPVQRFYANYPSDIAGTAGWEGEVTGICKVAGNGRCSSVEVVALPGMPESVRRYARASLERWEFEPQQIDGKPIEGEFKLTLKLNTLEAQMEDFREDKFLRMLKKK